MIELIRQFSGTDALIVGLALLLATVISLGLHEFGHAFTAYKCGDMTAKNLGRMTPNPLVHIDPIGLISCFLFGFGWAKPVPINPLSFRHYRKGMILTSLAGILVNLVLAFFFCGGYVAILKSSLSINNFVLFVFYFCQIMYILNVSLFVFNLLPVAPLDGFKVLDASTKHNNSVVNFLREYGMWIVLIMLLLFESVFIDMIEFISKPMLLFWGLIF